MKRKFFTWNTPFLPAVAKEIVSDALKEKGSSPTLDLSRFVYVLPGKRAERTLEAYLQKEIEALVKEEKIAPDWTPPTYVTLGSLPERLYDSNLQLADHLTRLYCMRQAVEDYFKNPTLESRALLEKAPQKFDAQLVLADTFLKLKDELDSERSAYRFIKEKCQDLGQPQEALRWEALEQLDKEYYKELQANGLTELNRARVFALGKDLVGDPSADQANGRPCEYRVLGAVDLNKLQKEFFKRIEDRVEFWVFAPPVAKDLFDEFGCVIPDAWERYEVPIANEQLVQVKSPVEQGEAVALLVREISKVYDDKGWTYDPISPLSLTIGVPDDEVVPFVEQRMTELGYKTILGEGTPIVKNRVYQLLANVADYIESRAFSSFEELVRRPDFYAYLQAQWNAVRYKDVPGAEESDLQKKQAEEESEEFDNLGAQEGEAEEENAGETVPPAQDDKRGDLIADLDRYRAQYLPMRVDGKWFRYKDLDSDSEKRNFTYATLRRASFLLDRALNGFWAAPAGEDPLQNAKAIDVENFDPNELKPDWKAARDKLLQNEEYLKTSFRRTTEWSAKQQTRPLNQWSKFISDFLCKIYAGKQNDPETKAQIDGFFVELNRALTALNNIPNALATEATGADAIRVVLKEISGARIAPAPGSNLVEMQGELDLLFDDAPYLILTGFNEGTLPSNRGGDLFLPNEMRSKVGLSDSKRAFARDAYLTTALVRSREAFLAVFEKQSLQGDPKTPSRFVFATDDANIAKRVVRYTNDKEDAEDNLATLRWRQLGDDGETVPFPLQDKKNSVDSMAALNEKAEQAWDAAQKLERETFQAPALDLRSVLPNKPDAFNVTDFESFLASPYRFLLKKYFNAAPAPDPRTNELDAAKFGTFTHDVLRAFGKDEKIKDATDPNAIGGWLSKRLDEYAKNFVNDHTSPFVKIQIEQIRGRLWAFARWQAEWRKTGAEIMWCEIGPHDLDPNFDKSDPDQKILKCAFGDGPEFRLAGRIDRIDFNRKTGQWYVFDYKTYDSPKAGKGADANAIKSEDGRALYSANQGNELEKRHRRTFKKSTNKAADFCLKMGLALECNDPKQEKAYEWINLQCPLYRRIFRQLMLDHNKALTSETVKTQKVDFAYVVLPKSGDVQAYGANWSEQDFECAEKTASWVVRSIQKLWEKGVVKPSDFIDEKCPEKGVLLEQKKLKFNDDYAPITLSYTLD